MMASSGRVQPSYAARIVCQYWASGYCARGESCWFKHGFDLPEPASSAPALVPARSEPTKSEPKKPIRCDDAEIQPVCSICYERPVTYGLLGMPNPSCTATRSAHWLTCNLDKCSHPFCLGCIRSWRSSRIVDDRSSHTKSCPLCRQRSHFITPSSFFYPDGPAKTAVIHRYCDATRNVPCRYFEGTKDTLQGPFCPFGDACHYRHTLTGSDERYVFGGEYEEMREKGWRRRADGPGRRRAGRRSVADLLHHHERQMVDTGEELALLQEMLDTLSHTAFEDAIESWF